MAKMQRLHDEKKLVDEIRSEMIEKTKAVVSELSAIEEQIENARKNMEKHHLLKKQTKSNIKRLHEKSVSGNGGEDIIDEISELVLKSQTIDLVIIDIKTRIKEIEGDRDRKLKDVGKELNASFQQIRKRIQEEVDTEADKLLTMLQTVESALQAGSRVRSYIPALGRSPANKVDPNTGWGPMINLLIKFDEWVSRISSREPSIDSAKNHNYERRFRSKQPKPPAVTGKLVDSGADITIHEKLK